MQYEQLRKCKTLVWSIIFDLKFKIFDLQASVKKHTEEFIVVTS